jgi:hypothetical protein
MSFQETLQPTQLALGAAGFTKSIFKEVSHKLGYYLKPGYIFNIICIYKVHI